LYSNYKIFKVAIYQILVSCYSLLWFSPYCGNYHIIFKSFILFSDFYTFYGILLWVLCWLWT